MLKNSKLTIAAHPATPASEHLSTVSSAVPTIKTLKRKVVADSNYAFARRTRSRAEDIDGVIQSNESIRSSSSSSSSSSDSMDVASDTLIDPIVLPAVPRVRRRMSIESKNRRELLKNKTRTCSACPAGNDAEFVHEDLSTPICGNCNKNISDDMFVTDETGQQLRCTWCGDGESSGTLCINLIYSDYVIVYSHVAIELFCHFFMDAYIFIGRQETMRSIFNCPVNYSYLL